MRALLAVALLIVALPALSQTAQEGKNLGALAAENLNKKRPKAPADMTGTYNFRMEGGPMQGFQFLPFPEFTEVTKAAMALRADYTKKGLEYKDDPAACWPLGTPFVMTRYWPIQIVQLPTMTMLVSMFNNNIRWIYTDGRGHPPDAEQVLTYNGHSIGKWEGNTLVVDSVGFTGDRHWIQLGIPTGEQLHIVERYKLSADRKALEIEFNMTDPEHWVGNWKVVKHWDRDDQADIEEHLCIYEQVSKLPGFKSNIRE